MTQPPSAPPPLPPASSTPPRPSPPGPLDAAAWAVAGLQLVLALWVAGWGPDGPLPMHFTGTGEVDRWGHRYEAVAVLLGFALLNLGVQIGLRHGAAGSLPAGGPPLPLRVARVVLLVVLTLVSALCGALGLGLLTPGEPQVRLMHGALALGWVATLSLGAVVGKARPNPVVGVRVRWTRHSRLAWDKANRLLGHLYFLGGLTGLLLMPLVDVFDGFTLLMVVTLGGGALSLFESWRVWRTDPERTG
ncbi:SdpI family protein [Aquabacterium sp. A7-Y]|uniref:SdpI family protein n=1 Tax=Aquabacterium sp. A7-Y TaxID=1349605 RepID=UPI00223DAC64|nr:SdpI family protein [Aquabacterium sp. A7-Y]MCW7540244.1 SdpI family protein [Aquabacterium sp. A7-Y]